MNKTTTSTDLRKFGFLLGSIFATLFGLIIPAAAHHDIPSWPWVIAMLLWLPALLYPRALSYVYKFWMKVGDILGAINSRIILGILFFFLITPIGIIKRTFGQDVMGKHYDKALKSYRTPVAIKSSKHMEKPF